MRVFFALELPSETALRIASWRERQLPALERQVPVENFHLTLAFVGEIDNASLDRLCLSVDDSLKHGGIAGANIALDQVGYWPQLGIYWVGPSHCPPPLSALAGRLRTLAARAGGKLEKKPFRPHVTLFRRCQESPVAPIIPPQFTLNYQHFSLFESVQGQRRVHYSQLASWQLS